MGICLLFVLSLSLLAEVVRILWKGIGKKGKPTKVVAQTASSAGFPSALLPYITGKAPAAVLGSWVVTSWTGLDQRVK
jgi:hypothetical protein